MFHRNTSEEKPIFDIIFNQKKHTKYTVPCVECGKHTDVVVVGDSSTSGFQVGDKILCSEKCQKKFTDKLLGVNGSVWSGEDFVKNRIENANISLCFLWAQLSDFSDEIRDHVSGYINGKTPTLLISSVQSGVGKTHLSVAILKSFLEKTTGLFITTNDMMTEMCSFSKDTRDMDYFKKIPILVLDDLGVEKVMNERDLALLYGVIDYRLNNNFKTIITTNLILDQIVNKYTQRVLSRITCGDKLSMDGTDKRISS